MATTEPVESWEQVGEALDRLDIKQAQPSEPNASIQSHANGDTAPGETPPEQRSSFSQTSHPPNGLDNLDKPPVDHAIRDALSRIKHRHTVLRLELEVEEFISNSQESQEHVFKGDMSSYDRMLAHRIAQYWGLDTFTDGNGPDKKVVATRTPHAGPPPTRLSDIEVIMEEPATSSAHHHHPPPGGPAPRVLTRRRNDRGHHPHGPQGRHPLSGGYPGAGMNGSRHMVPMEEREQTYERARAKIFGESGSAGAGGGPSPSGGGGYGGGFQGPPQPPMMPHGFPPPFGMNANAATPRHGQGHSHGHGAPSHQHHASPSGGGGHSSPRSSSAAAAAAAAQAAQAGGRIKAQLRNRQEDLSDPDFRRGRHGPRFDPGFGEDAPMHAAGMYYRPTYGTEFPQLGSTTPGGAAAAAAAAAGFQHHPYGTHHHHHHHPGAATPPTPPQAAAAAAAAYPAGMMPAGMPQMMAYSPAGYVHPATGAAIVQGPGGIPMYQAAPGASHPGYPAGYAMYNPHATAVAYPPSAGGGGPNGAAMMQGTMVTMGAMPGGMYPPQMYAMSMPMSPKTAAGYGMGGGGMLGSGSSPQRVGGQQGQYGRHRNQQQYHHHHQQQQRRSSGGGGGSRDSSTAANTPRSDTQCAGGSVSSSQQQQQQHREPNRHEASSPAGSGTTQVPLPEASGGDGEQGSSAEVQGS